MLRIDASTSPVYSLAFRPDSALLASGGAKGEVFVTDSGGTPVGSHNLGSQASRNALQYAPSGDRLAVADGVQFLELGADDVTQTYQTGGYADSRVTGLGYLDDRLLVVGSGDRALNAPGAVALWTLPVGKRREPTFSEPHGVRALAVHPSGKTIVWANGSRRVTVRNITKPDPVHFNLMHNSTSVAVHPDGNLVAAAIGYEVAVLDVARKQQRATLRGHGGTVAAVAFSPDGRTLATGSWDKTVRFWEVGTWAERTAFKWNVGRVLALAFAPDGTRAAAGGDTGAVLVWDLE